MPELLALDVLPKADRLDDVSDPKPVQEVPSCRWPQEKTIKIISRHWRDNYAKVKKRKRPRHHVTRTKHRRAHRR